MKNGYGLKIFVFLVLISALRLMFVTGLDVVPDEADYYIWSEYPDLCYYDQPPMLMYFLAIFSVFIENKFLVVKLVTILFSALTAGFMFILGKELCDGRTAFFAVILANLTLMFTAGSLITTTDTPMVFFLTGAAYYFFRAVKQEKKTFWLVAGLLTGCALLSKFIAVLIYGSFFLYLMLPGNRKWFKKGITYLSFLISILVFSPVIYWNYAHEWVAFSFQLDHGFGSGKFPHWISFFEFIGGQTGLIGPILFALFIAALVTMVLSWTKRSTQEKYLWCLAIVTFVFFFLTSLQKKVEANWPCFAYIPGILLTVVFYENRWKRMNWARALWAINWVYSVSVLSIVLIHIYMPIISMEKERADEFFGWKELGAEVVKLAEENPGFHVAANRYQEASEIAFYSDLPVICFNINSRPNQFDLWQDRDSFIGKNFLFFDARFEVKQAIVEAFEHFEYVKTIPLKRGDKLIADIRVYRGKNFRLGAKPQKRVKLLKKE